MSLKNAMAEIQVAMAAVAGDGEIADIREFLAENGVPLGDEVATLTSMLGTITGRLVDLGGDPSAIGTVVAVLGASIQDQVAPKEGGG